MATNKNITMKQFNGTDYDTLYPKTIASQITDVYSQTEILTTETLTKYGLTADKFPNDVFQQIKVLIDNVQSNANSRAKIQTGSYVGTGTYGASNPCSLTFNFVPKIFMIPVISSNSELVLFKPSPYESDDYFAGTAYSIYGFILNCDIVPSEFETLNENSTIGYGFGYYGKDITSRIRTSVPVKLVNTTLSWFARAYDYDKNTYPNASDAQFNTLGKTYYWIAIG